MELRILSVGPTSPVVIKFNVLWSDMYTVGI